MKNTQANKPSPWAWIPSLYFAEGIPYVVVMTVAVVMFKRLGISNTDIALYTSWLYLPWVIKPLWSPVVDLLKTKRWWIITMQLFIGATLGGIALVLPLPIFFKAALIFMWLLAFSSATHDIAADGFYMLALDSHDQAYFVGIRSTFYRIAMITGQGVLIIIAGSLESWTGLDSINIDVQANREVKNEIFLPEMPSGVNKSESDALQFIVTENLWISTQNIPPSRLDSVKNIVKSHNEAMGFVRTNERLQIQGTGESALNENKQNFWTRHVAAPLTIFLRETFNPVKKRDENLLVGNVAIGGIMLNQAPKAGKEIVLNAKLSSGADIALIDGERLTFNADNWDKIAYVLLQVDKKATVAKATVKGSSGNIQLAWSILFFVLSALFISFFAYHKFVLPRPKLDKAVDSEQNMFKEFFVTFGSFFKKKEILSILAFLLLYRLGESQIAKMASPFLIDTRNMGGLGLTTGQLGLVYGTIGILMLTIGGILGGMAASKKGLRYWIWPMALGINLPNAAYVYLAYAQPENLFIVATCVGVEQFCYGFAFTAYMLYMIYVCESSGTHKTAHYAICTGFMALGMMIPGMISGWIQDCVGYTNFFIWVMICAIPSLLPVAFVKIKASYGRKEEKKELAD